MPRKNKPDAANEELTTKSPVDEIEGDVPTPSGAEEPKKEWKKRPDPFDSDLVKWADGYKIQLLESDANREVFVRFGNGTKSDAPKNFEAIRKMMKEEHGMYWDVKVQGWAKELRPGQTPLIKEQNRRTRSSVVEAFSKAIALEEAARGPSLSETAHDRTALSR